MGHARGGAVGRNMWGQVRGFCRLARGDLSGATSLAEELGLPTADDVLAAADFRIPPSSRGQHLFLALLLLAQGRYDAALVVAEGLEALDGRGPDTAPLSLVEAAVLQALAWQGNGSCIQAMEALTRALDVAAPIRIMSTFVVGGEPTARLLRQATARGIHAAFARELLEAIAAEAGNYVGLGVRLDSPVPRIRAIPEPLSPRERHVLRLLSVGLTRTEIAEQLVISVETARSHIRTIYRKLDVHSRREAIEAAEQAGLI